VGERPPYPFYIQVKDILMKTSIQNGINTSLLNWDYFITLNKMKRTTVNQWEREMEIIMNDNDFCQIYWSCEKSNFSDGIYHTHLLVDTNNLITINELVVYFSKYLVNGKEISYKSNHTTAYNCSNSKETSGKKIIYDLANNENKRMIEYKTSRNLIGPNNQIIRQEYFEKEFIPFYEIQGKMGRGYIETIKGIKNTSIYLNKFTDRGITTGYLKK
jgi:hypothetical protein